MHRHGSFFLLATEDLAYEIDTFYGSSAFACTLPEKSLVTKGGNYQLRKNPFYFATAPNANTGKT